MELKMSQREQDNLKKVLSKSCIESIKESEFIRKIASTLPSIVLLLNENKEVVYYNQRLTDLLHKDKNIEGIKNELNIIGNRLGEIFDCINARQRSKGCGLSDFCSECGVAKSVSNTSDNPGKPAFECRIITTENYSYDLRVHSAIYNIDDTCYTFVSLEDISEHKRKEVLERTFFHDINNLLHIINGYSEILTSDIDNPSRRKFLHSIKTAGKRMSDEIDTHKRIIQAENGSLAVNVTEVNSIEILAELTTLFTKSKTWSDKHIIVDDDTDIVDIKTDKAILLRILNNMTKNALEATTECGQVTLKCSVKDNMIVFSVHNCGYIPYLSQGQIFQRSYSTKGKGRGIGTYSMKLFGEKYLKGKVWFKSSEIEGTTFIISIPIDYNQTESVEIHHKFQIN